MFLSLLLLETVALLTPGQTLPTLKGQFLTGKPAVLPDAARGKITLLALGFSYDSRFAVEAWSKRFRQQFGLNSRVTFFEVPMLGSMARMGKWFIDSGMRKGTPKEDHERVVTVWSSVDEWKRRLQVSKSDDAYLILLDAGGTVRWLEQGDVSVKSFDRLAAAADSLLKPQ